MGTVNAVQILFFNYRFYPTSRDVLKLRKCSFKIKIPGACNF